MEEEVVNQQMNEKDIELNSFRDEKPCGANIGAMQDSVKKMVGTLSNELSRNVKNY